MTKFDLRQELVDAMDAVDAQNIRQRLGADGRKFKSDFQAEGRDMDIAAVPDVATLTGADQR